MSTTPAPHSPELRAFVDAERWTFAKTMPDRPHEYIVREQLGAAGAGSADGHE
jgi:hypothetical protein